MILLFQLTMPGVGSWNGKFSGANRFYGKVVNIGRSKQAEFDGGSIVYAQPYSYSWDDGWSASIAVTKIDAKEAERMRRVIRKANEGFLGYDWMVDSIIQDGKIMTKSERAEGDNDHI